MQPIRLGLVGYGKIAQDQHLPAIRANPMFSLEGVATQGAPCPGVPNFGTLTELLASQPGLDAIAFCTPPQGRHGLVHEALKAGKHVLVEKPPCASLGEAMALVAQARDARLAGLFAWHSRFAPGVEAARAWLVGRPLKAVRVQWKESVRKWHPGQTWIWRAGGLGVFDPGINALSIVTELLPTSLFIQQAELRVPANCQAPIAATMALRDAQGLPVSVDLDFDHGHDELWRIELEAEDGTLRLDQGGAVVTLDGMPMAVSEEGEYPALYRHFHELVQACGQDMDVQPLRVVADAFFAGERTTVEPFYE